MPKALYENGTTQENGLRYRLGRSTRNTTEDPKLYIERRVIDPPSSASDDGFFTCQAVTSLSACHDRERLESKTPGRQSRAECVFNLKQHTSRL